MLPEERDHKYGSPTEKRTTTPHTYTSQRFIHNPQVQVCCCFLKDGTITTEQNDPLLRRGVSTSSRRVPHFNNFVGYQTNVTVTTSRASFFFKFYSSSLTIGGGGPSPLENRLKTCTNEDPTTTKRKKKIRTLGTFDSSDRSAALPTGTAPRLVMFLSNLLLRLRIFRGRGCHGSWID
jgi:hypothetical protein